MKLGIKWVSQLERVSSKRKTEIVSAVFILVLAGAGIYSLAHAKKSIASDITVDKIMELTNASRAEKGESNLTENAKLEGAALKKADDMIKNNYFSHTSPQGLTPWHWIEAEKYDYNFAGENLAMDFHTVEKMEEAWMASPTHRANILNEKYLEIGAAVKVGKINNHETILAVVMFGSGDKNSSGAKSEEKDNSDKINKKEILPALPIGENKKSAVNFRDPIITSPQAGEIISGKSVNIYGRGEPWSTVTVFDNEKIIGSAPVNESGWFQIEEKDVSDGSHRITLAKREELSIREYEFFVDSAGPEVNYRLFADKSNPQEVFLEAKAGERNCLVEFDGERRMLAGENSVVFSLDLRKTSAVLRVYDRAGNKNYKQVNLANLYFQKIGRNNISEKLSSLLFSPKDIFAAESGRDAIQHNLGLASHQLLSYRLKK